MLFTPFDTIFISSGKKAKKKILLPKHFSLNKGIKIFSRNYIWFYFWPFLCETKWKETGLTEEKKNVLEEKKNSSWKLFFLHDFSVPTKKKKKKIAKNHTKNCLFFSGEKLMNIFLLKLYLFLFF